jgi:hypothetical protein
MVRLHARQPTPLLILLGLLALSGVWGYVLAQALPMIWAQFVRGDRCLLLFIGMMLGFEAFLLGGSLYAARILLLQWWYLGFAYVRLEPRTVAVGEPFQFTYRRTVRRNALVDKADFVLILRESNTYRTGYSTTRGTLYKTSTSDHWRLPWHVSRGQYQAGQPLDGSQTLTVPAGKPNTYHNRGHRLQWFVQVEIYVIGMPRLTELYEIVVHPGKSI